MRGSRWKSLGLVPLCLSGLVWAQQGILAISPEFSADQALSVRLANFSMLPVKVSTLTVELGAGECTLKLPEAVEVAPGVSKKIVFAPNDVVKGCLKPPAPANGKALVLGVVTDAERSRQPKLQVLKKAKVNVGFTFRSEAMSDSTTWHFTRE